MGKLVIVLAALGFAYWYWFRSPEPPIEALEAARLKENAAIMQQCIRQEQRMQSAGGLGGLADVGSSGEDAERACAAKHGLEKRNGEWHKR